MSRSGSNLVARLAVVATLALGAAVGLGACEAVPQTATAADQATTTTSRGAGEPRATLAGAAAHGDSAHDRGVH